MVKSHEETDNNSPAAAAAAAAAGSISALNCIDLSSSDIQHSVRLLKQACLESGFFYVTNHGIHQEFMEEVFEQSRQFFRLPLQEKMMLLRNEKNRGYTPILDEHLDPVNQVHGDYKEGFYIGVEVAEGDPEAEKPFHASNLWPKEDALPGWRETMEKYHRQALEVARKVAGILALALDLDADFFNSPEILGKSIATLRLLHYEGQISEPTKGIYGAGAHTDFGMLTLLATDDIIGLQICKDKNAENQIWEFVPPLKGKLVIVSQSAPLEFHTMLLSTTISMQFLTDLNANMQTVSLRQRSSVLCFICAIITEAFIVNLGDMLERWSNCVFRSTLHRVLGNGQERYSIAFFVSPSHDCDVKCLPTCQSEDNPPRFSPVNSADYLLQRYAETHANLSSYKQ